MSDNYGDSGGGGVTIDVVDGFPGLRRPRGHVSGLLTWVSPPPTRSTRQLSEGLGVSVASEVYLTGETVYQMADTRSQRRRFRHPI